MARSDRTLVSQWIAARPLPPGRIYGAYYPDGGIDDNNWRKILAVGQA